MCIRDSKKADRGEGPRDRLRQILPRFRGDIEGVSAQERAGRFLLRIEDILHRSGDGIDIGGPKGEGTVQARGLRMEDRRGARPLRIAARERSSQKGGKPGGLGDEERFPTLRVGTSAPQLPDGLGQFPDATDSKRGGNAGRQAPRSGEDDSCLLYTSDAADE